VSGGEAALDPVLTLEDIRAAAHRIAPHGRRTPGLSAAELDAAVAARVYAKAESLQRSGSFKARGAFNRLSLLSDDERRAGIVAYSSGNHGAAVALAAHELAVPATVVVPHDAPAPKIATIEFFGAEVRRYDPEKDDRVQLANALARERGLTLVPPYDDLRVMAGQGTLGTGRTDQVPGLDVVVVPVSGGGLVAGVGTAVKATRPAARLVGVEPVAGDDTLRSLKAGQRVSLPYPPRTIADGLRTQAPGELTFPVYHRLLDDVVTVDDDEIAAAMRLCFELLKVVVEPSGAVALAALMAGRIPGSGASVGVVLSGGNVDPTRFADLIAAARGPGGSGEEGPPGVVRPVLAHNRAVERHTPASAGHTWR